MYISQEINERVTRMPLIVIHGLAKRQDEVDKVDYQRLITDLCVAVSGIQELVLTPEEVSISIPWDACEWDNPDVIAVIEGLYSRPERTPQVRRYLARAVGTAIINWLKIENEDVTSGISDTTTKVEVIIPRFNPSEDGFFAGEVS